MSSFAWVLHDQDIGLIIDAWNLIAKAKIDRSKADVTSPFSFFRTVHSCASAVAFFPLTLERF
jgi:hypothetical protein